jgi:FMN phosphatase YigB (HAD superfamily)
MTQLTPVVFLLDVDNTLLDNDRIIADLKAHLTQAFGAERQERYWAIFEKLRLELGYADYLGALQRYRAENPRDPHFLQFSDYLLDYPFADRLFPGALEVIARLHTWGPTIILSDGDVVFQPRKIERSGLFKAVAGRVLIYIHKERELADVEKHYSARHYVLVDDKLRILTAVKKVWGGTFDDRFSASGTLRLRPQGPRHVSPRGHCHRIYWRPAPLRPAHSDFGGARPYFPNRTYLSRSYLDRKVSGPLKIRCANQGGCLTVCATNPHAVTGERR